jgi:hypothetical protein
MICPWAGAKTLIFTNFLHTGPLWNSVSWRGLIRSIEAKIYIPKKRKKPEARAEERKKSQTAVITLVSTGTGRGLRMNSKMCSKGFLVFL